MVTLLAGIFIKDKENTSSPEVRQAWGLFNQGSRGDDAS